MNRGDFKDIADQRIQDAEALLRAGRWSGAYYLAGYAVECALKSIICKRFVAEELPPKGSVDKIYTHDLQNLLSQSQVNFDAARAARPPLGPYWDIVKTWTEQSRYETISQRRARDMIEATIDNPSGVLTWLKNEW